jgi:hypothetical protein
MSPPIEEAIDVEGFQLWRLSKTARFLIRAERTHDLFMHDRGSADQNLVPG